MNIRDLHVRGRAHTARTAVVTLALLVGSACAHQTTYMSEPPGAEVFIDGERKGETPLVVDDTAGAPDVERVLVRDPRTGESMRFDVVHDSFHTAAVLAAVLGGIGTFLSAGLMVVPFLVGYGSLYAAIFTFSFGGVDPMLAIGGVLAAFGLLYGSYAAGIFLAASAPTVALFLIGESARVGPDEVFVDFTESDVTTSPADLVIPLAGGSLAKNPSVVVDGVKSDRPDASADATAIDRENPSPEGDSPAGATSDDSERPAGTTSDDKQLDAPDELLESLEGTSLPHP